MSTATEPNYEVAGEPGVYWCARHRKVKTRLRCGRCEKPICIKCTKYGPTGARCPDCASNRTSHMYQVSLPQYAMAFGAAALFSAVGAAVLPLVGFLAIWALLYASVLGPILGKGITRITQGKRGPKLAAVVSVGVVVGSVASFSAVTMASWKMDVARYETMVRYLRDQQPATSANAGHAASSTAVDEERLSIEDIPPAAATPLAHLNPIQFLFLIIWMGLAIAGVWWWLK